MSASIAVNMESEQNRVEMSSTQSSNISLQQAFHSCPSLANRSVPRWTHPVGDSGGSSVAFFFYKVSDFALHAVPAFLKISWHSFTSLLRLVRWSPNTRVGLDMLEKLTKPPSRSCIWSFMVPVSSKSLDRRKRYLQRKPPTSVFLVSCFRDAEK